MERIDIVDNFLPEDVFNPLFDLLSSWNFPWDFNDFVVDENSSLDNYQFTHTFINSSRDIIEIP